MCERLRGLACLVRGAPEISALGWARARQSAAGSARAPGAADDDTQRVAQTGLRCCPSPCGAPNRGAPVQALRRAHGMQTAGALQSPIARRVSTFEAVNRVHVGICLRGQFELLI